MADGCAPEGQTIEVSEDQLVERVAFQVRERLAPDIRECVKSECQNLGLEDVGDGFIDRVERALSDRKKLSQADLMKRDAEAFRESLFAGSTQSRANNPVANAEALFGKGSTTPDLGFDGRGFVKMCMIAQKCGYNQDHAVKMAKDMGEDTVARALQATNFTGGGALIPEDFSTDFIAALYSQNIVRRAGARSVEMPTGELDLGRQDSTATAYWVGEGSTITVSEQTFGRLKLSAKKLGVLVPLSNDLLRRPTLPRGFGAIVRDDIMQVAANAEDIAMIRGTGTSNQPKGIKNWLNSANIFAVTAQAPTIQQVITDLLKMQYKVVGADIPMLNPGWMFAVRTIFYLRSLYDTNSGMRIFMEEMRSGGLFGSPFYSTTAIPRTLDASGDADNDETEIYFGDFGQVVIGETLRAEVTEHRDASYVDANSNQVNGVQSDETVIRVIHEMDLAVRREKSFAVLTDVAWGQALDD